MCLFKSIKKVTIHRNTWVTNDCIRQFSCEPFFVHCSTSYLYTCNFNSPYINIIHQTGFSRLTHNHILSFIRLSLTIQTLGGFKLPHTLYKVVLDDHKPSSFMISGYWAPLYFQSGYSFLIRNTLDWLRYTQFRFPFRIMYPLYKHFLFVIQKNLGATKLFKD